MASRLLSALAAGAAGRARLVLAVAAVLALAGGALALGLTPTAATETFVGRSSASYQGTQRFYRHFGEEPIQVLVKGNLQQLLLSSDIERLLGLEGCLSGRVPPQGLAREGGNNGPCGRLARLRTVKVAVGPGTFVNEAAEEIDEQLAGGRRQSETRAAQAKRAVSSAALARGLSPAQASRLGEEARGATLSAYAAEVASLAVQYGISSEPAIDNAEFVGALVFDRTAPAGTPKRRFAYLFPSPNAALVSVRLRAGLSEARRSQAIALIRRAVAMPQWHLEHGERYLVSGAPVIVSDLTSDLTRSIQILLVAVVLVMALVLSLIFTGRPRLLPLAIALLASALTFGALALSGGSLTVGSLAVLPVLVGLAVDYAIQLQSRTEEALANDDVLPAIRHAAALGAPTIALAALASAGAMLALLLSPVPLVRGFGVLLVVGIAIAFLSALTAGSAAIVLWREPHRLAPRWRKLPTGWLAASWRGARELARENPLPRLVSRAALEGAVRRPWAVVGVGLALALAGWALSTQTRVETDLTKLVPQSSASLRNLAVLERETGVGGQIDLLLHGSDLTQPAAVEWMSSYESAVLARFGYDARAAGTSAGAPACAAAKLCPAFSLPDLFQQGVTSGGKLSQAEISGLLDAIPPYFSQSVISPDRRFATLAFGIRLMPLSRQQRVIEEMRTMLHPPTGMSAQLVGLSVLAAQADAQVSSPSGRALSLLISLAVVAAVLLLIFRGSPRRTLAVLTPVVLASGWSGLLLFLTRVPLNPMSVTLSILVVAISTEFSVLLAGRYRQERLAGREAIEALRVTYSRTGAAVAASGVTAVAGFGVLAFSDVRMLRDFGLVTMIDLGVSLLGVLLALPSAVMLGEPQTVTSAGRGGEESSGVFGSIEALERWSSPFRRSPRTSGLDSACSAPESSPASVRRWRSVIEPSVFRSDIGTWASSLRQRVWPQRR
jgi:hydrophobe/amphiphile efflux-3 (HAE3) family protein